MSSNAIPEGYYSEEQIADMLSKTVGTLRADHSRRKDRVPPKTRVGNLIVYSKASFDEWLKSKETNITKILRRRK